ncbi:integrase [Sphingomonas insulae]|uniref:Tyr recombinase domain-containing protein n=1 Tax=Sphingomonas insulae TaxID=424800 RepID=A0ABN1HX83_9SPHN|nr:tyrosine-type recombinase/integrase [Sphingomonas insulae]NIJ29892.1 integrase [Sphingomonas insulae]
MNKQHGKVDKPKYTYIARGTYWRFRYRDFQTSLPGQPGEPEFLEKYQRLLTQIIPPERVRVENAHGSFSFVLEKFFADVEFRALAHKTQEGYRGLARKVEPLLGDCDMTATTSEMIAEVRNTVPIGSSNGLRAFISRLYNFASKRGYVEKGVNRARELDRVKIVSDGHVPWSDDEIVLLLKHAKGAIRTLLILGLCTGQRAGDIERTQWSQVLGDSIRVRQGKTRELLDIPLHPMLRAELDYLRAQGPVSGAIVRNHVGNPVGRKSYNRRLTKLIASIPNFPHRTPHGGRYATAAMLEDAGCTVQGIMAIIGHRTYQQAIAYLIKRKEAGHAMARLVEHAAAMNAEPPMMRQAVRRAAPRLRLRLVSLAKAA